MAVTVVGSFPLGGINLAATAAVGITGPILAELDLMLFGAFGLGGVQADISLQFSAAINASLNISLQLTNPFIAIQGTLNALANIAASLQASLGLALPNLSLSASLSASAALSAALGIRLGGIQLLISAALAIKLPAVDFIANLSANLGAGPIVVASWGFATAPTTLAATGSSINTLFSAGLGGLVPGDTVYGVLLVTKQPSASAAISATMLVV